MASRMSALTAEQVTHLLDWVTREGVKERAELAAQTAYGLAREGVPIRWCGSAAEAMGLTGDAPKALAAKVLRHGVGPNGEQLCTDHKAPDGSERRVSYSFVFSADKTISVLSAMPEAREAVLAAHRLAMAEAVAALEELASVRRGAQGRASERIRGVAGIIIDHFTSSAGDPHLHAHLIISASAPAWSDGKWRALDSLELFTIKRIVEAVYQRRLGEELARRLGLEVTYRLDGIVPTAVIAKLAPFVTPFSRVTAHMQDVARELGMVLGRSDAISHELIWRRHRQHKSAIAEEIEHRLDAALAAGGEEAAAIVKWWAERAREVDADLWEEVRQQVANAQPTSLPTLTREEIIASVYADLTAQNTFVPADVVALLVPHYGLHEAHRVAADLIEEWSASGELMIENPDIIAHVLRQVADGEHVMLNNHDRRLALTARSKGTTRAAVEAEENIWQLTHEIAREDRRPLLVDLGGLDAEQARVALLMAKGRAFTAVEGVAGAGKSHLLSPVVEAARREGMRIIIASRNAELANRLGTELGIEWISLDNLTRKVTDGRFHLAKPTLVIVDEAGVGDREDWMTVLRLAQDTNGQVVAVGDRLQAQPIDRLATWATIYESAIAAESAATLSKSWRCKAWHDEHDLIRAGDPRAAEIAEEEGRIITVETQQAAYEAAADTVLELQQRGEDAAALAVTNAAAGEIASAVQERLGVTVDPRTRLLHEQQCGVGDIVRTRHNDHRIGVLNGQTWVVDGVTPQGDLIVTNRKNPRHQVRLPLDYTRQYAELAYSATVDSAQGMTVDRAVVLVNDLARSRAYSATTRGRQAPVYVATTEDGSLNPVAEAISRDDIIETAREVAERVRKWREAKAVEAARRQAEEARRQAEAQRQAQLKRQAHHWQPRRGPDRGIGL